MIVAGSVIFVWTDGQHTSRFAFRILMKRVVKDYRISFIEDRSPLCALKFILTALRDVRVLLNPLI